VCRGKIPPDTFRVESERKAWQNRSLDEIYPILYQDVIVVKIRHEGRVLNKAIHLALGVNLSGHKELLGMWVTQNESSKFWLSVLTKLQNRGVKDSKIYSLPVLMDLPDSQRRLKPFFLKLRCSFVLSIWSEIRSAMCPIKTVRLLRLT
jgi:putative transposase